MRYRIIAFDFEVFATWWCVVFQDLKSGKQVVVENDARKLRKILSRKSDIFIGWNSKFYDQAIAKAICTGASNKVVKDLNDWIITHHEKWWTFWWFKQGIPRFDFNTADVMDDTQFGLSLKAIEGHMKLPIVESSVPFTLERELTRAEKDEVIRYCKYDVNMTARLIRERADYFRTKAYLGKLAGLELPEAISMTNAKMVARYLGARKRTWRDERVYDIPEQLRQERIPSEVFEFFARMDDPELTDDEVFKSKLELEFCGIPTVFAYGGIHGARLNYIEGATDSRMIVLADVSSMYPHSMINFGYVSRNIPDPDDFRRVVHERMEAKRTGDEAKSDALKLVANTTYGAMLNEYNDLYDPRMGRSVCVTGQLMLADLGQGLVDAIPNVRIIQFNTDGVMLSLNRTSEEKYLEVCDEWCERTGYQLEHVQIQKVVQRDVNNYAVLYEDGEVEEKGGELVRGARTVGAWNINNNANAVATAIRDNLLYGIPVEDTLNRHHNILDYQFIAKAGGKYSEVIHEVDGKEIPVQKVNRVYATKDTRYGTLRKIHAVTGSKEKIASIPDNCLVDNENELTLDQIDLDWYAERAREKIKEFYGKEKRVS